MVVPLTVPSAAIAGAAQKPLVIPKASAPSTSRVSCFSLSFALMIYAPFLFRTKKPSPKERRGRISPAGSIDEGLRFSFLTCE